MKPTLKLLAGLLLGFLAGFGAGCATTDARGNDVAIVQRILDLTLPPDFRGNAHVDHKNSWIDFTIDAGDLRREGDRWVWTWLRYKRNGRFSTGNIILGTPPSGT